jgi:Protein of unknown function (DUF2815)
MAKAITSEPIRLERVRLSFPNIYKPKVFQEGQTPRFQATALLDPSDESHKAQLAKLKAEMMRIAREGGVVGADGKILPEVKLCIGNGNTKSYDGYKDMVYVSMSNTVRPTVVNRAREPVGEGDAQAPYAGCYVNVTCSMWVQNNKFGKRINANLRAIQFVEDGPAFGRAPVDADAEFEALEGGASGITDDDIAF